MFLCFCPDAAPIVFEQGVVFSRSHTPTACLTKVMLPPPRLSDSHVPATSPPPPPRQTSKQLTLKSYEMGVMFLPSLMGPNPQPATSHAPAFTCTPGEAGLTQRLPLTLGAACDAGQALPLKLLPLPYTLPGMSHF